MKFELSALAGFLGARLEGPDRIVDGLSIDSRSEIEGRLFVPLVAERDGHEFVADAAANGAAAYLTSQPRRSDVDLPAVVVAATDEALTRIGRHARERLRGPVIGITGSVGKTSVKDLTLAACRPAGPVSASLASFNNELGVPLTLANASDGEGITIVEMGARGIGHIAQLCEVAHPTVGLITCVALAHSELFGSIEGVARAKGELVEALPASGVAVLNADDPNVAAMATRTEASVLTFGTGTGGSWPDVCVADVRVDRLLRPTFTIESDGGRAEITLAVRGAHMALNAGAALAGALAAGVGFDEAVDGLRQARISPWRMEVGESPGGALVINDAYNANPTSMRAALGALVALEAERPVAVLGAMAELGEEGPAEHRAVIEEAVAAGIRVVAVDAAAYGPQAEHVTDRAGALERLGPIGEGDAVLVKGSRVAGLERLARVLLEGGD